jgi:dipeptidyl-peptidase-4
MNKNVIAFVSFFFIVAAFGQTKKLTLEESVMQQYRAFRPDQVLGFQWIPETTQFVYFEELGRKLIIANPNDTRGTELMTLSEVNTTLKTDFKSFWGIEWKDASTLIFSDGASFYDYNFTTKKGNLIATTADGAANQTMNSSKNAVAFTEKNNLYFIDKNNSKVAVTAETNAGIVSGQTYARSEFGITGGIFWSPKSSYLAFYQKDETEVADYPLLDITETPGKLMNIKYPMIGQKSEKPRVGIYNLAAKKTVFITPKGANDAYLTNLSWTPDEKYVLIAEVNRGQDDMSLHLYDAQTGAFVRTLLNEKNDNWVEPEHPAFFPSKTSNDFVWFSEKDGFQNLYYYSIEGKLIKQLTANKFVTKSILGSNSKGTELYFEATGPSGMNTLAYKVDLKGKQTLMTATDGTHTVAVSHDGSYFFDEYSNHTTPSKSLLVDAKSKEKVLVASTNKYKDYQMGTSEIKMIKAADGTTDLVTRLIKPSNFDASKKYPVLVYVYGGPHAQLITNSYLDGANLWMYWMAEQGYLIFTVDNRGSENRGFAFESIIHGRLGVHEMDDQMKGVAYLKSLPYVDVNRLAVHGWSFGGFMTTSLMLRKPGTFTTGVAGGPVTDWNYYEVMYGERYMDTPAENQKGFDEANTLNYVKNLEGKLLLIHGTVDDVVVMQNNLALVKKFIEAEKQIDFFPYPMHKHNVNGKDRVHLMKKVLDYVIENNK